MIALVAIFVGLVLGAAAGGSIRGLRTVSFRFEWPVLLLFLVQGIARGRIAGASASSLGLIVWVLSCSALLVLWAWDWRLPGIWVASVGMALNVFVVLLNGGMPISLPSDVAASEAAASVARSMGFYQLAGPGTLLGWMGDVLSLGAGSYRILASPGDLLLALGVTVFIVGAMVGVRGVQANSGGND